MTAGPLVVRHTDAEGVVLFVRAYETLDRARDAAWDIVNNAPGGFLRMPVLTLARILHAGETLPIPDGSTITVEATERAYYGLWRQIPYGRRPGPFLESEGDQIVAAWNAEHAIGGEAARCR